MHFNLADLAADIAQNSAESGAGLIELAIWELDDLGTPDSPAVREFRFFAGDNGKGMTKAVLDKATDPFVTDGVKHPGRKVGLGLPFLIQTSEGSGGGWRISSTSKGGETALLSGGTGKAITEDSGCSGASAAGIQVQGAAAQGASVHCTGVHGTSVEAWFDLANVDTPPVGDIPGLFRTALLFAGPKEIVLKRSRKVVSGKENLDYEIKKTELIEALGGDLEDVSSLVLLGKYLRSLEGEGEDDAD